MIIFIFAILLLSTSIILMEQLPTDWKSLTNLTLAQVRQYEASVLETKKKNAEELLKDCKDKLISLYTIDEYENYFYSPKDKFLLIKKEDQLELRSGINGNHLFI